MRISGAFLLGAVALFAACDAPETPTGLDEVVASYAQQDAACKTKDLKADQKGKIKPKDCLFEGGAQSQREDLYRVDTRRLGIDANDPGARMLTFTADAEFDGIYGISNWDDTAFGDPVYGFSRFVAGESKKFSLIGSADAYKFFFSGKDETQLGRYTLTTTAASSVNTCEAGHTVFLEGRVDFPGDLRADNSCLGTIQFSPDPDLIGTPLTYQYWFAKLKEGQQVSISLEGVDPGEETLALVALRFGTPFFLIDLNEGPGDTDRHLSFTAPFEAYYYIEVSAIPPNESGYHLSFDGDVSGG